METELDTNDRKRIRDDDSDGASHDSPKTKLHRVDSAESGSNSEAKDEGTPVELENSVRDSPEVKRIQEDLLNMLDESDDPAIQGLDSVIKSFEEEILVPAPAMEDVTSFSGGSQPDLGFLLEASDDELGIPPPEDNKAVNVDFSVDAIVDDGQALGFGDGLSSFDPFEMGLGCDSDYKLSYNESGDCVALGGLFNFSDENMAADVSQYANGGVSAL